MSDIRTTYLGMALRSPLVASPSPVTRRLDDLLVLDDAGIGAVVLPSLFEEEIEAEELTLADRFSEGMGTSAEAFDYFPDLPLDNLGLERHLRLVREATTRLDAPVIASLNGTSAGGWVRYAKELVDAGAAAIELNMYDLAVDPTRTAADVEAGYLALVRQVREAVSVPLAVKLSPYFTSFANMAASVSDAGADGLVLFNRFYQPDLDLDTLDVTPTLDLSTPADLRLPLRWVAILRPQLPLTSLAITSGVHSARDVVKALLAGADAVMTAAALLHLGPEHAVLMLEELQAWMAAHEYESVSQLKGSVAQHTSADPAAFERAQYQKVLHSWRR